MKVPYTRSINEVLEKHRASTVRFGAEGSVEQNRGLTNRNLILRPYIEDEAALQTKVQSDTVSICR